MKELQSNLTTVRKTMNKLVLGVGIAGVVGSYFFDKSILNAFVVMMFLLMLQAVMDHFEEKVEATLPYHVLAKKISDMRK
jgi:uncharacterized membrane protein YcaP (DUF421 family)